MAGYDVNGNYSRWYSWQADDVAQIGIVSDRHDKEDDEFAKGLNLAFLRDGRAPATADWNLAGKVIHNLGTAATPADGDAVNYGLLTGSGGAGSPAFKKGITISGAGVSPNYLYGAVNFSSLTGANGLSWAGASMALLARIAEAAKTRDRLVLNNAANGTGNDVMIFDDAGNLNLTGISTNLSLDAANNWRTIAPGYGARMWWNGVRLQIDGMDAATVTDPYVIATLRTAISFDTANGSAAINLVKNTAGGGQNVAINGMRGTELRWQMQLGAGDADPDNGTSSGSTFYLQGFSDSGAVTSTTTIKRSNGLFTHSGQITAQGLVTGASVQSANGAYGGDGSNVFLRPAGYNSSSGQTQVALNGDVTLGRYLLCDGIAERAGTGGTSSVGQVFNLFYDDAAASPDRIKTYVGTSWVGTIAPACDYRIKREVRPIDSCWEKVKALRPIAYKEAAWGDVYKDRDDENWGFIAHELQDALGPQAASGAKDDPELQHPHPMAIIAALTAALQEAQLRIEALEARLAA